MPAFLKGSIIVKLIMSVISPIMLGYKHSRFKRFIDGCGVCCKSSCVYSLARRYFYHPAYFEYSLTLRFILWLVKVFDVPVSLIGRFFTYLTKGSLFTGSALALADSPLQDRFKICGVIGSCISLGFGIGLLIKGAPFAQFIPMLVILGTSVVIFLMAYALDAVKHGLVFRFIRWLTCSE